MENNRKRQICFYILSAAILAFAVFVLFVLIRAYVKGNFASAEAFQEYIKQFGSFGPVVLTVFQACEVILPILPGFLGCAVGSALFGTGLGFLCNYIGVCIGSFAAFALSRKFGMPLIHDLFPKEKCQKWLNWTSKKKSYTLLFIAAIILPFFPDDFLCYLTGVTEMSFRKFFWIIVLCKPWCLLAYCMGFSLIL